ncbi:MAG TPA: hypothetical protein VHX43_16610 [Xanthobacteraceae bacterium]|nr:hypothetical protein [Xanthobacteraceae bacterium]
MIQSRIFTSYIALVALIISASGVAAGMAPCVPANDFGLMCGSGEGAARAIVKTISPSQRFAFAWRFTNKPPTNRPDDDDSTLENLAVRIKDGAVLAKSKGAYWDLGTKIAKAYLMTAWSPDSRLLVKVEQRAAFASVEVFAFAGNDAAIGPVDLAKIIEPPVLAKMDAKDGDPSGLVFAARPPMTLSNQGLLHAIVQTTKGEYGPEGPLYDVAVQLTPTADSINAKVVSLTPHAGMSISIKVH